MTKLARISVLASSFLTAATCGFAAEPAGLEPYEMVRSVEALQDQIVLGNQAALAAQPKLMGFTADALASASPEAWKDEKNVRAISIYLLSGGRPQVIEKLLSANVLPQGDLNIVNGALAFDEGRQADAKQFFADIDARSLAQGLSGYVAFTQAKLFADDRQKETHFLDLARLLAPGTLIEEAALRREVFLADDMGDVDKFVFLSGDYIRRFRRSLYLANFRQRFASAVIHLGLSDAPGTSARLEDLFKELSKDDQRTISLMIARAAIIAGKTAAVRFSVDKAYRLTSDGSVEKERTKLYDAAALILSSSYDKGVQLLQSVNREQLPKPDADLDDAISTVAQTINRWSDAPQSSAGKSGSDAPHDDQATLDLPVIAQAKNVLAEADKALKESIQ